MNSTKNEYSAQIEEFFSTELIPLAKKLHREHKPVFFHKKPDPGKDTYFIKRRIVTMTPESFEMGGCNSSEDLKIALANLWTSERHTDLAILTAAIAKLAESIYQAEEQDSEVSPFIYVMF